MNLLKLIGLNWIMFSSASCAATVPLLDPTEAGAAYCRKVASTADHNKDVNEVWGYILLGAGTAATGTAALVSTIYDEDDGAPTARAWASGAGALLGTVVGVYGAYTMGRANEYSEAAKRSRAAQALEDKPAREACIAAVGDTYN